MRHTKFLLQRLACVPWLLAAGLALGWVGEAAAQTLTARFESMPESHDGSEFAFEVHFSEEVEMSFVNMREDVFDVTGGTVTRARRLQQGSNIGWEIAIEPDSEVDVSISLPPTVDCAAASAVCTADSRALSNGLAAIVSGPATTEDTEDSTEELEISAEQAVQADYRLSVNPARVREDAGATEIAVTVEVTNDTAVEADTYVLLSLSSEGLNSRFFIGLTTLMILTGEKRPRRPSPSSPSMTISLTKIFPL